MKSKTKGQKQEKKAERVRKDITPTAMVFEENENVIANPIMGKDQSGMDDPPVTLTKPPEIGGGTVSQWIALTVLFLVFVGIAVISSLPS